MAEDVLDVLFREAEVACCRTGPCGAKGGL